jgi:hypothetical protein
MVHNPTRRPRWLIILTLLLSIFQIGSATRVLQIPADVAAQIHLILPLEFIASAVWAILAALVMVGLFQRWQRAQLYATILLVAFTLYSLVRLALFAQADYDRERLPFLFAVGSVFIIITLVYIVRLARARTTEKH